MNKINISHKHLSFIIYYNKRIDKIEITFYHNKCELDKSILKRFHFSLFGKKKLSDIITSDKIETFVKGLSYYIVLCWLFENKHFVGLLPFHFKIPCTLDNGDCCNKHVINYLSTALQTIIKISKKKWLIDFLTTIITFAKTWKKLFPKGPSLSSSLTSELDDSISSYNSCTSATDITTDTTNTTNSCTNTISTTDSATSTTDTTDTTNSCTHTTSTTDSDTSTTDTTDQIYYHVKGKHQSDTTDTTDTTDQIYYHVKDKHPRVTHLNKKQVINCIHTKEPCACITSHISDTNNTSTCNQMVYYHSSNDTTTSSSNTMSADQKQFIKYHDSDTSFTSDTMHQQILKCHPKIYKCQPVPQISESTKIEWEPQSDWEPKWESESDTPIHREPESDTPIHWEPESDTPIHWEHEYNTSLSSGWKTYTDSSLSSLSHRDINININTNDIRFDPCLLAKLGMNNNNIKHNVVWV